VLGKTCGVSIKELYQLFPKGRAKTAAKIAGIPKSLLENWPAVGRMYLDLLAHSAACR
jgi:hypothetical protein